MKVRYPERVVYPAAGFRKRDVLAYYERIAPVLLPHLPAAACAMQPSGNWSSSDLPLINAPAESKKAKSAADER